MPIFSTSKREREREWVPPKNTLWTVSSNVSNSWDGFVWSFSDAELWNRWLCDLSTQWMTMGHVWFALDWNAFETEQRRRTYRWIYFACSRLAKNETHNLLLSAPKFNLLLSVSNTTSRFNCILWFWFRIFNMNENCAKIICA